MLEFERTENLWDVLLPYARFYKSNADLSAFYREKLGTRPLIYTLFGKGIIS